MAVAAEKGVELNGRGLIVAAHLAFHEAVVLPKKVDRSLAAFPGSLYPGPDGETSLFLAGLRNFRQLVMCASIRIFPEQEMAEFF